MTQSDQDAEFDYSESYEFLAERFYEESGYMAPGKSVAPEMAYTDEQDADRRMEWDKFMSARNREAWVLWHKEYGYLKNDSV